MGSGRRSLLVLAVQFLAVVFVQRRVHCYQYKVGDLDAWGIPPSSNPNVYAKWAKTHFLTVGDSLLFLYPPSQDSVLRVTPPSYKACNLKNPILSMNDGNSVFNITSADGFYFISGKPGHCQKGQKLQIGNGSSLAYPPAFSPSSALPDTAAGPSYANAFGSIPSASAAASVVAEFWVGVVSMVGLSMWVVFC